MKSPVMNYKSYLAQTKLLARWTKRILVPFALVLVASGQGVTQIENGSYLSGTVIDGNGNVVSGAEIEVRSLKLDASCKTDYRGIFKCKIGSVKKLEITIRADGFSILRQTVANIQEYKGLKPFRLQPAEVREDVVVSVIKAKTSLAETPASVFTLNREDVKTTAAASVDGVLRRGVGFSLFRRTSSRTSNPTTQGASLRGVNSSGASRSGVLVEGVPMNDPFGGWVVWSRIPRISLERIDVLRGGSSPFYGSGSIGGTVAMAPRRAEKNLDISAEISAGLQNTFEGSVFTGLKTDKWSSEFVASSFQTEGYRIIDPLFRGAVDDYANSRNTIFTASVSRAVDKDARLFGKAQVFGEARNNGTPVQKNRSQIRDFAAGFDLGFGTFNSEWANTRLTTRLFGGTQGFDQSFSAVAGDRASESLVRTQRVPAQRAGILAQLGSLYRRNSILFGFEGIEVRGSSDETGYFGGTASSTIGSGGRERKYSLFFQDFFRLSDRISLTGSIRYDRWRNFRGLSSTTRLSTQVNTTTVFDDRSKAGISPFGAINLLLSDRVSLYASAGRSFRAPTLNELYRGFRVGNVITNPNPFLDAERAASFEGGVRWSGNKLSFRASGFRTTVSGAIANVTFDPGPGLILRQRQNAGETRSQGLEIEAGFRTNSYSLSTGYLFLDARIVSFESASQLVGLRIPQVPVHQITVQGEYRASDRWIFSFQGRGSSSQFDDDLNVQRLERYFQMDLYAARTIGENSRVFITIENVFNSRYSVRLTPVRTISAPISLRAGIRWN